MIFTDAVASCFALITDVTTSVKCHWLTYRKGRIARSCWCLGCSSAHLRPAHWHKQLESAPTLHVRVASCNIRHAEGCEQRLTLGISRELPNFPQLEDFPWNQPCDNFTYTSWENVILEVMCSLHHYKIGTFYNYFRPLPRRLSRTGTRRSHAGIPVNQAVYPSRVDKLFTILGWHYTENAGRTLVPSVPLCTGFGGGLKIIACLSWGSDWSSVSGCCACASAGALRYIGYLPL